MKPLRLIQFVILILSLLKAFILFAGVYAQAPEGTVSVELPATVKVGEAQPAQTQPPAKAALPSELVNTWYTGALPLTDVYDPVTGSWRAQNGLGESYTFGAKGDYTYAAFLRLQNGQCLTEVSVYKEGKARAANGILTLTPAVAKTRTRIQCGSTSDTTTDGPFDVATIAYDLAEANNGELQLTLSDGKSSTAFYRQGIL